MLVAKAGPGEWLGPLLYGQGPLSAARAYRPMTSRCPVATTVPATFNQSGSGRGGLRLGARWVVSFIGTDMIVPYRQHVSQKSERIKNRLAKTPANLNCICQLSQTSQHSTVSLSIPAA